MGGTESRGWNRGCVGGTGWVWGSRQEDSGFSRHHIMEDLYGVTLKECQHSSAFEET